MKQHRIWFSTGMFLAISAIFCWHDVWIVHDRKALLLDIVSVAGITLLVWFVTTFGPRWRQYWKASELVLTLGFGYLAVYSWFSAARIAAVGYAICSLLGVLNLALDWKAKRPIPQFPMSSSQESI
jgi:hypothetical protein